MSRYHPENLRISSFLMYAKGYGNKDIVVCPDCLSLNLKDKQFIITPAKWLLEINVTCEDCGVAHYRKIELEDRYKIGTENVAPGVPDTTSAKYAEPASSDRLGGLSPPSFSVSYRRIPRYHKALRDLP